jgi:hypothetical protein
MGNRRLPDGRLVLTIALVGLVAAIALIQGQSAGAAGKPPLAPKAASSNLTTYVYASQFGNSVFFLSSRNRG